uniref:Uncharacterized protein n=1 Tax=Romanomermis culicivorax TaxID=13658 RepID=A0A915JYQ9_ROMCU
MIKFTDVSVFLSLGSRLAEKKGLKILKGGYWKKWQISIHQPHHTFMFTKKILELDKTTKKFGNKFPPSAMHISLLELKNVDSVIFRIRPSSFPGVSK